MDANDTRWLSRKDWRRLVELHATGRITRRELDAWKERLARVRREVVAAPVARPALRLLQGGGRLPAPRYLTPSTKEVA
jgi:multidrug resistance efflux pump